MRAASVEQNRICGESRVRLDLIVTHTWFGVYASQSANPRTLVGKDARLTVSADGVGSRLIEEKFNDPGADIVLTRNAEMRLIVTLLSSNPNLQ